MKLNYVFLFILALFAQASYAAGYAGNLSVNRIRMDDPLVYFGTTPQPASTCSNWGEYFKFDHTTPAGKSFLSTLLMAKASGKFLDVWYIESSSPGTTQANGCNRDALSVITGIGVR